MNQQEQPARRNAGAGRFLIWLAVLGIMIGLTALYQAIMPEHGGQSMSLTGDGSPAVMLERGRGGHFRAQGAINGVDIDFLVDTGATDVAISDRRARALGLEFGPRVTVMTAAGPVAAWITRLDSVRVGNLERRNVRATITPGLGGEALLGMSFLRHYSMRQQEDLLIIEGAK